MAARECLDKGPQTWAKLRLPGSHWGLGKSSPAGLLGDPCALRVLGSVAEA